MAAEEDIKQKLSEKFPFLQEKIAVKRKRRIFLDVDMGHFREVLQFAIKSLNFTFLCTVTGLDETDKFSLMYQLDDGSGIMLNIRTSISREDPVVDSITPIFPNADIYEREMVDLFGIKVKGLPKGERYPLPDDWPAGQYPLRKDWKSENLDKKEII